MNTCTFYVTTAIDYVNSVPHIGHAYEKIATDAVSRFQKMLGHQVFFLTGSDEHGTKVEKTALKRGLTPHQHTDELVVCFKQAWEYLNIAYDRFIRTTEAEHYAVVTALWLKMQGKGDIYKKSYQGQYCTGCEKFLSSRELSSEGICLSHQLKPEITEEENYFFRLTRYKDAIREYIQSCPDLILPVYRATEVLKMLEDLEDISVSRPCSSVSWGIPVPGDSKQVIYVWIDALSNYLTGIGYLDQPEQFNRYWPEVVHVIGKDILRFHAIYWPAMLLSADIPLPKRIIAHGFININDSKISKTLGNVISPFDLRDRFALPNSDPIRYYLMTVTNLGQDGSFTEDEFKLKINADLSNNLGNLLNRTLKMTEKYFECLIPEPKALHQLLPHEKTHDAVKQALIEYDFQKAVSHLFELVDWSNKEINEQKPWDLYKNGELNQLSTLIYTVLETLRQVAILMYPVTPILSAQIHQQLGFSVDEKTFSPTWQDLTVPLQPGQKTQLGEPILPRLDSELVGIAKKA
jgi:methionyl-tRNA synthetase